MGSPWAVGSRSQSCNGKEKRRCQTAAKVPLRLGRETENIENNIANKMHFYLTVVTQDPTVHIFDSFGSDLFHLYLNLAIETQKRHIILLKPLSIWKGKLLRWTWPTFFRVWLLLYDMICIHFIPKLLIVLLMYSVNSEKTNWKIFLIFYVSGGKVMPVEAQLDRTILRGSREPGRAKRGVLGRDTPPPSSETSPAH